MRTFTIIRYIKPYYASNTRNFCKIFNDVLVKTTYSHIIVPHNVIKYQILVHTINVFIAFRLKLLKKDFYT